MTLDPTSPQLNDIEALSRSSDAYADGFDYLAVDYQPWLKKLRRSSGGRRTYGVFLQRRPRPELESTASSPSMRESFTNSLEIGDGSWVVHGAILRGVLKVGKNSSVNGYAHIAGRFISPHSRNGINLWDE
jgi:hypothetical protein